MSIVAETPCWARTYLQHSVNTQPIKHCFKKKVYITKKRIDYFQIRGGICTRIVYLVEMALFNVAGETDRSLFLDIELRKDLNLYDKASELCGECGGVIGNSLFLGIAIGLMWVFDSCSSDVISGVLDKFWQKTLSRLALLRLMSNISVNLELYDIFFLYSLF